MTDLTTFNPFDADTLQCPFPHYAPDARTRAGAAHRALGVYLVTRHDLVLEVLRDPRHLLVAVRRTRACRCRRTPGRRWPR